MSNTLPGTAMPRARIRVALAPFAVPSTPHGLTRVAADWALIAFAAAAQLAADRFCPRWLFWAAFPVTIVTAAAGLRGLEACTHEASHSALFGRRSWNTRLQWLFAFPIVETVQAYRRGHSQHHGRFGTARDTTFRYYRETGLLAEGAKPWWLLVVRPLLGWHSAYWLREVLADAKCESGYLWRVASFWAPVALGASLSENGRLCLLVYAVALVYVLPVLIFWSEASDHIGLDPRSPYTSSRTNLGILNRMLIHRHNDGFHRVHHLEPRIPAHLLPRAHSYLDKRFPEEAGRDALAACFLKTVAQLWDGLRAAHLGSQAVDLRVDADLLEQKRPA